jgi:hypothetical protein
MNKFLLLAIISLLQQGIAVACDCLRTESFCETFFNDHLADEPEGRVVRAVVSKKTDDKLDFKVIETLFGKYVDGKNFHFLKGNIFDFEEFDKGKEYIIIINQPLSEPQFYYHWCGTNYLAIENGKVIGKIMEGVYELSLSEFINLPNCGVSHPSFIINPTLLNRNKLIATPKNWFVPIAVEIQVFNSMGQLVHKKHIEDYSGVEPIEIDLDDIAAGVYFCQISFWGKRHTTKVVKVN